MCLRVQPYKSHSGSFYIPLVEATQTVKFPLFWYVSDHSELSGPAANLTLTSVWLLAWHNLTKSPLEKAEKEKNNYSPSPLLASGIIT